MANGILNFHLHFARSSPLMMAGPAMLSAPSDDQKGESPRSPYPNIPVVALSAMALSAR